MRFVRRIPFSVAGLILLILTAIAKERSQAAADAAVSRARAEAVREKWLRVSEVFSLAGIAPGAKVADIGAGDGFLTVRLARDVGPNGRVYAVDIEPGALRDLRKRVREEGLSNVEVVEGAIDDPRLPRESLDAAIMLNAYHEMTAYDAMLRHIFVSLKPTGRLVLVEPTLRFVVPDRNAQRKAEVLSAQFAEDDLRKAGFQIAELRDPFVTELSRDYFMWLIVAHRASGILLSPVRPAGRGALPADRRKVVTPPGEDDIMGVDLRMSADKAQRYISSGRATFVDIRSDTEYRTGHIPGAISVQPFETDAKLSEIASRAGPVFVYSSCA